MKDAYYFSHDSNSKDDPKCVMLIEQLGCEGYGIFWILVETLRDQPDYKYPLSLLPAIARRYNTSIEKIKAVVNNYKLFTILDDEFFFSESLNERMQQLENKRAIKSNAGKIGNEIRWNNRKSIAELSQSDCKSSLVKYSKVNESKTINIDFDIFWNLYDKKVGDKIKIIKKWELLTDNERTLIIEYIPKYKLSQPDKKYRKNPDTFFNNKSWNDELINLTLPVKTQPTTYQFKETNLDTLR